MAELFVCRVTVVLLEKSRISFSRRFIALGRFHSHFHARHFFLPSVHSFHLLFYAALFNCTFFHLMNIYRRARIEQKEQKRKEILIVVQRMNERTILCFVCLLPTVSEFDALKCIELDEQRAIVLYAFCDVPSSKSSNNNDGDGNGNGSTTTTAFTRMGTSYTDSLIAHPPFPVALLNWNNFMFRLLQYVSFQCAWNPSSFQNCCI